MFRQGSNRNCFINRGLLLIFGEKIRKMEFIERSLGSRGSPATFRGCLPNHSFYKDNKNNGKASWKSELGQA